MTNKTTPICPQGLTEHIVTIDDVTLTCHIEFEQATRGAREIVTGQQLEPDYPAYITVYGVYADSATDIQALLSDAVINEIVDIVTKQLEAKGESYDDQYV